MNTIVTYSFIIQIKYSNSFNCRFLYVSQPLTSVKKELESLFEAHIEEGTPDDSPERQDLQLFSYISSLPMGSRKQQFMLLSSISNFHHFRYPLLSEQTCIIKPNHVNYVEHLLYDPDAKENVNGDMIRKYIPTSPRNRLMYLLVVGHAQLWNLMKYVQTCDSQTHTYSLQQDIADEIKSFPPAPKKCKQGPRIVSVTARSIVEEVGANLNNVLNSADSNHTIYKTFNEQLVTEGIIRWHYHDDTTDVCIMNDVNTSTGFMMPNLFVHITSHAQENQDPIIKCSCAIFDLIQ